MRIGIDARIAAYNSSGISRYLTGLVRALCELNEDAQYVICESFRQKAAVIRAPRCERMRFLTPPHFRFECWTLPWEVRRAGVDIFHAMDFFAPAGARQRTILTVHDLYFLKDPSSMERSSYLHYRRVLQEVKNAAAVICDSHSTREDLLHAADVEPERVHVVYPGFDPLRGTPENSCGAPYLLSVGTIEPRKNYERIARAYAALRRRLGREAPAFKVAGRLGFRGAEIVRTLTDCGVEWVGAPDDEAIAGLQRGAVALVYASLYEGFGFPLLEGFAAGVPVLSSAVSSLPEVAGDAALLVDPLDEEAISAGMERLLCDSALASLLVERGRQQATVFSWEAAAKKVYAIYRGAL